MSVTMQGSRSSGKRPPATGDLRRLREIRTARMVIRPWRPDDAAGLKDAIDASLDHLRPWMPWAAAEPTPVAGMAVRLRRFRRLFRRGADGFLGLFEPDGSVVLGGAGLHSRVGAGGLEIGYWVRVERVGAGLATEAAAAVTRAAFELARVRFVEIHCDPANGPSAAVARRLGYDLTTTVKGFTPGPEAVPRDTMIWRLTAKQWPDSAGAGFEAEVRAREPKAER